MEGLDIKIDHKAVEKAVVQAVVDSAIGKKLEEQIEAVLSQKGGMYGMDRVFDNTLRGEIERAMAGIIREMVQDNRERIREMVAEKMTDEVLLKFTGSAIDYIFRKVDE